MRQITILVFFILTLMTMCYSQSTGIGVSLTLVSESCYDGLQNQNETGIDCGGICDTCATNNQNKRGGLNSGTNNPPENLNPGEYIKYYFFAKDSFSEEINNPEIAVSNFEVKLAKSKNNITLYIKSLGDDFKIVEQNKSSLTFQYFKVEASNINIEDIVQVNLQFRIPKSWVTEKNTSFEEFTLLKYSDKWEEVETTYLKQDFNYYYFESKVNALGYFAIAGRETSPAKMLTKEDIPDTPIIKTVNIIENPENFNLLSNYEKIELIILSISLTVLVCLGVFHVYKRIWVDNRQEKQKLEKELEEEKKD